LFFSLLHPCLRCLGSALHSLPSISPLIFCPACPGLPPHCVSWGPPCWHSLDPCWISHSHFSLASRPALPGPPFRFSLPSLVSVLSLVLLLADSALPLLDSNCWPPLPSASRLAPLIHAHFSYFPLSPPVVLRLTVSAFFTLFYILFRSFLYHYLPPVRSALSCLSCRPVILCATFYPTHSLTVRHLVTLSPGRHAHALGHARSPGHSSLCVPPYFFLLSPIVRPSLGAMFRSGPPPAPVIPLSRWTFSCRDWPLGLLIPALGWLRLAFLLMHFFLASRCPQPPAFCSMGPVPRSSAHAGAFRAFAGGARCGLEYRKAS